MLIIPFALIFTAVAAILAFRLCTPCPRTDRVTAVLLAHRLFPD